MIPDSSEHGVNSVPKVPILYAPTASGKTAVSLLLAKRLPVEIVSADSRQVFRLLDIGTAKASLEERSSVPHHCIDIVDPDERYSAGRFRNDALKAVQEISNRSHIPLVVGGSGLYIQALCGELFEETLTDDDLQRRDQIRADIAERLRVQGRDSLYDELQSLDPGSALLYADKNPSRVARALEYYYLRGVPLSVAHQEQKGVASIEAKVFVIDHEREELNKRIEARTNAMWDQGIVREVENILSLGFRADLQSLHSVGYHEVLAYLSQEISADEALRLIAQNTRRYAKRQRTWARHQFADAELLRGSPHEIANSLEKSILTFLKQSN